MTFSNILYFRAFIVSHKIESMAKKKETTLLDDIFDEKSAMLGFIDIFRKAIKGDKLATKLAERILDEWQEECYNLPDESEEDDNIAFLHPSAVDDAEDDDFFPSYENSTLQRPNVSEYHLRIKLNDTNIKIWRELKVPSNLGLDFLGHVLIDIMGWDNMHLFQFMHNKIFYSDQESVDMSFRGNVKLMDKFALSDLLKAKGDRMMFEYDFGDSWRHDVWIKGIRLYEKGEKPRIEFVKGQGACPPEDCGGVGGYEYLLELLQKQKEKKRLTSEEREELEWADMDINYDPNDCDNEYYEEVAENWNSAL